MKTQCLTTRRESLSRRFLWLLLLAIFSPATLVCAQSPSPGREKESLRALIATVKEQQEQIRQQQKQIDSLKLGQSDSGSEVPGTIVGSGTPVKRLISVTQSVVFSNANESSVNVSVPGAQTGDLVLIGVPDQYPLRAFTGTVDKADDVRVRIYAPLPGPAVPTPPILVRVVVIGF